MESEKVMAIDFDQMPHLLALLDDPSDRVQVSIKEALQSYGDALDEALTLAEATDEQRAMVERLIDESSDAEQLFQVGQLVRHKRYGYRGVVVSVDAECQAADEWYESNKTQPDRDQPWYHVLADGSDQVFYPAQTSLEPDESEDAVKNPNVKRFFSEFLGGSYVRNDKPFPSSPPSTEQGSGGAEEQGR
jgi:heat shock protein HspQ